MADLREEKPYTVSSRIRDVTDASYTVSLVTRPGYFLVVAAAPLGVAGLVFIGTI